MHAFFFSELVTYIYRSGIPDTVYVGWPKVYILLHERV